MTIHELSYKLVDTHLHYELSTCLSQSGAHRKTDQEVVSSNLRFSLFIYLFIFFLFLFIFFFIIINLKILQYKKVDF